MFQPKCFQNDMVGRRKGWRVFCEECLIVVVPGEPDDCGNSVCAVSL
jgi:hypothetical protein